MKNSFLFFFGQKWKRKAELKFSVMIYYLPNSSIFKYLDGKGDLGTLSILVSTAMP